MRWHCPDLKSDQESKKMFKPELLSPAGTLKNMRYAYAYGADAVYAGQPRYSLRVRNNEFDHANVITSYSIHYTKLYDSVRLCAKVLNFAPLAEPIRSLICCH